MTAEYLLESIGRIDDALIVEAAAPARRHAAPWLRWGALAAAVALCVGLAALRPTLPRKGAAAPAAAESETANSTARSFSAAAEAVPSAGTAPAPANDVFRPVFFLNGSSYHIIGFEDDLPDGCISLGVLISRAAAMKEGDGGTDTPQVTVNDEPLVGHAVWQAENGDLFIALDGGGYARATMSKPAN